MIYPEFPKSGDIIGICAPSAGVGDKIDSFELSEETLAGMGFGILETASVRNSDYPSAPADIRGAEFNRLYSDDNVNMVICASGGDYCIEMLPYINQELVRTHPKWFAGYSDPTSIEMLLTTKLDIATIYGCNAGAWDWRPLHKFQEDSLRIISGDIVEQHSYDFYASNGFDEEKGGYNMDAPVKWLLFRGSGSAHDYSAFDVPGCAHNASVFSEASDGGHDAAPFSEITGGMSDAGGMANGCRMNASELHEEHELDVTGRLIGGCIDVIDWIIGTQYEDLEGFCARYAEDGFIWFFDNFEMNPLQLQYAMRKMHLKGLFDNARAVVFGRTCFPGEATDADYLLQLERVFGNLDVPLIWNADIGHTKPSFTIINGSVGHLTYKCDTASLSMELR